MPFFVFVMFLKVIYEAIRGFHKKNRAAKAEPLCGLPARARAVCHKCAACDLLRIRWFGASHEIGCAVLHRLSGKEPVGA
jgi:hypothetical protein